MGRIASLLVSLAVALTLGCPADSGGGRPRADAARFDGGGGERDAGADALVRRDAARPDVGAPDSAPREDAGCEATTPVETEIVGDPPDMLLIVDISGSMCTPLGLVPSGPSKLAIMKEALTTQVTDKEGRINFGLMLFPGSSNECAPGTVEVPIAPRNAAPISSRLAGLRDDLFGCALANSGATPTGPSVDAARSYYGTIPVNPIGRYALLATDGLPNCGAPLPDGGTEETVDETVAAIEALHAAGVTTYVLGFGSGFGSDPSALNRMATAGGTPRPFSADSPAALDAALEAIAAEIIPPSCTVELDGPTRDPMLFQVRFDGGPLIPRNMSHTSGWDYDPATNTITFYGTECEQVQSGSVTNIEVDFGCPGPLI